ncbi:MAG: PepSY domain-containing protein [Stappiaceae bacterium]
MTAIYSASRIKTIAVALAFVTAPTLALAEISVGDSVGKTEVEIRSALTKQGYSVEEIEQEDGKFEAEVALNGEKFEIEIDPQSGDVLEVEIDD